MAVASLLALGALTAAPLVAPQQVGAAPALQYWTGTVTRVVDGDTIWVDIAGDGKPAVEVRNAGIQATEIKYPAAGKMFDECHSLEAKARMSELVFSAHKQVRLSAYSASSQSQGRLMRYVDVDTTPGPGETWVDVQQVLLEEGYVWWKPERLEPAHNASYHVAAEQGMQAGGPLYNPNYHLGRCKEGPAQATPISLTLKYNGYSPTYGSYVNGEYAKVRNGGTKTLALAGWTIRDSSHVMTFAFPKSATVKAKSSVVVRVGKGTATKSTFYWGRDRNIFPNPVNGLAYPGDGLYLLDPDGDVRGYMLYPCVTTCSTALAGKIKLSVQYDAPGVDADNVNGEYVQIERASGVTSVNLAGYVLEHLPYNKILPTGAVLDDQHPILRVKTGTGTARLTGSVMSVYLGVDHPVLGNSGGSATVRDAFNARFACVAWGSARC
ncbi:MAG TPA: lamin tail domain-containing protein [Candidatus Limnocylindria bacterium]|nr:lamin tail domain-containing protein [Candidatus Limnocylindria bacterium]